MNDHIAVDTQVREAKRDYEMKVLDMLGREDMSQSDLARACDLTPQHVAFALHHSQNPTLRTICRIAAALGCRVRLILEPAKKK